MKTSVPVITPRAESVLDACVPRAGLKTWLAFFGQALTVRAERRELARLDDRGLKDLGLSRADVEHEVRRSFFDLPPHRREG